MGSNLSIHPKEQQNMPSSNMNLSKLRGTKLHLVNRDGDALPNLYMEVTKLPSRHNGVGMIHSVDEEANTVDKICFRVNADGTLKGWLLLAGESEDQVFPLTPKFDNNGEVKSMTITFDDDYSVEYVAMEPEPLYYPSEEVELNEPCIIQVAF